MKLIYVMLLSILVVGCEVKDHYPIESTSIKSLKRENIGENYSPTCIDGVIYYTSYYMGGYVLSPKFNRDGTVALCGL